MSKPAPEPLLYPLPQASAMLQRSVFSVRRMIWSGLLEAVQFTENGKVYVTRESIEKCIENHRLKVEP